jgi:trimethylamine-N-oxide reductase (cytochrome c)
MGEPGYSTDRGGCINQLTPKRSIAKKVTGTAANSCLVQVVPWDGSAALRAGARDAAPARAPAREEQVPAFAK